jgi:hypothetical protein
VIFSPQTPLVLLTLTFRSHVHRGPKCS